MSCPHPPEERLRIYDGTAVARTDRRLCGLCGETVYELALPEPQQTRVSNKPTYNPRSFPSGPHV